MTMTNLTHFNAAGEAHMVDVGDKPATQRRAVAEGWITMHSATLQRILQGEMKKGDVLAIARIAGIMASKKTAELIPLCHPLPLTHVAIHFAPRETPPAIRCETSVATTAPTGVEMEALTATQIALLTIYDMCKAIDRSMCITEVRLLEKAGGRSGHWRRDGSSDEKNPDLHHTGESRNDLMAE